MENVVQTVMENVVQTVMKNIVQTVMKNTDFQQAYVLQITPVAYIFCLL